jgi:hypothetical protein
LRKFSLRLEPAASEVKGKCPNHLATDFVLSQDVLEDDSVHKENLPPSAEPKNRRCPPKRKNPTRLEKMEQNVEKILMFMERWKHEENNIGT